MILREIDGLENETFRHYLPEDVIRAWIDEDILIYGAEEEEKAVGACAVELLPDRSAKLLHLYIRKDKRGEGLGQAMFDSLIGELLIRETDTLRITTFPGENPAFDKILDAYDITEYESGKTDFSFLISEVKSTMFDEKTNRTRSLEEATQKELEMLSKTLLQSRDCPVLLDVVVENADPSISFLFLDDAVPKGALFAETKRDEIRISFLWSHAKKTDAMFELFSAFADAVKAQFPDETRISFVTIDEKMAFFIRKILGVLGKTATEVELSLLPIRDFEDEQESEEYETDEWEELAV